MSRENLEIVRDWLAAANEQDFPRAMDHYGDDVELFASGDAMLVSGTVKGREAVGRWFGDWFSNFRPGYHFEIEELWDVGDTVLAVARHGGEGKASGVEVTGTSVYVIRIEADEIVFVGIFFTHPG